MSPAFRKLLLVIGAMLIAGAIAYYPWMYIDDFTGAASTVYMLTSIYWAPAALVLGVVNGALFACLLWPRKPKADAGTGSETGPSPGPPSIEA